MYKKLPWLEEVDKFIQPSSMGMTQESPNFISKLQKNPSYGWLVWLCWHFKHFQSKLIFLHPNLF